MDRGRLTGIRNWAGDFQICSRQKNACRTLIFPGGAHSPNIQATVRLKADRIKQFELSPQKTNKK
jgi:hypothetical protein